MKKSVLAVIVAVVAVGLIGVVMITMNGNNTSQSSDTSVADTPAQADSTSTQQESTQQTDLKEVAVKIEDFAFSPAKLTIKKGTTVTWTNQDSVRHDVVPDDPTLEFKASELLSKGDSYRTTFMTPGVYTYFCSPHPYMKASIEVIE